MITRKQKKAKDRQKRIKKAKNNNTPHNTPLPLKATTPKTISDRIKKYCNSITGNDPFYVRVTQTCPSGKCFLNCLRVIKSLEVSASEAAPHTEIIWGWLIWEGASILEFEHHAILKIVEEDGEVIYEDFTKTVDGEKEILFVPHSLPPLLKIEKGVVLGAKCNNLIYPNKNITYSHIGVGCSEIGLDDIYTKCIDTHPLKNDILELRKELTIENFKDITSLKRVIALVNERLNKGGSCA